MLRVSDFALHGLSSDSISRPQETKRQGTAARCSGGPLTNIECVSRGLATADDTNTTSLEHANCSKLRMLTAC